MELIITLNIKNDGALRYRSIGCALRLEIYGRSLRTFGTNPRSGFGEAN